MTTSQAATGSRADPMQLGTRDTSALGLLALFTAAFTIWVDVV
jgi:hypothetical protein